MARGAHYKVRSVNEANQELLVQRVYIPESAIPKTSDLLREIALSEIPDATYFHAEPLSHREARAFDRSNFLGSLVDSVVMLNQLKAAELGMQNELVNRMLTSN